MARKARVVRKSEVPGNGIALLKEAQGRSHGLLFAKSAYKLMKVELRDADLTNTVAETEVVEIKGKPVELYAVSHWGKDGMTGRIRVDYRVKLYTNSVGKEVRGNRLSVVSA